MRLTWVVGVIVGVLILYLGIFGLAGVGLSWTSTTLPTTENFDDLGGWALTTDASSTGAQPATISPAGQVQLQAGVPPSGTTVPFDNDRCAISSSTTFPVSLVQGHAGWTMSMLMKIDAGGLTASPNFGNLMVQWYMKGYWWNVQIEGTGKMLYGTATGPGTVTFALDSNWHTWTFSQTAVGTSGCSIDAYYDTAKLVTFSSLTAAVDQKLSLDCFHGMLCHIDKITIVDGNSNPGQPTTGSLTVTTTKDGSPLSGVAIAISGPASQTATSDASGTYTFSSLAPGSYSVSGSYGSVSNKAGNPSPVSVTAGGTAASSIDFTVTTPGTGTITITAKDLYGNGVPIDVTITGPTTKTQNTGTTGITSFVNLPYGAYHVSGTYNSETKSTDLTITSSAPTASYTLQFTSQYVPTQWDAILKTIRAFIAQMQTPLEILGGLITAISSIMLILPAKTPSPPNPPRY